MKKKKLLYSLIIALALIILFVPKVYAARRPNANYTAFRTEFDYYNGTLKDTYTYWAKFFNDRSRLIDNQYSIYASTSEFFTNYLVNHDCAFGSSCKICKVSGGKRQVLTNKVTPGQQKFGDLSDFRYFMTHYSTILCLSEKNIDDDEKDENYTLTGIVELDENNLTIMNSEGIIEKDLTTVKASEREDALTNSARMAYYCYFSSEILADKQENKYKKLFKEGGSGNDKNGLFFETQRKMWQGVWQEFYDYVLYDYDDKHLNAFDPETAYADNPNIDSDSVYKVGGKSKSNCREEQENYIKLMTNKVTLADKTADNTAGITIGTATTPTIIGPYQLNLNNNDAITRTYTVMMESTKFIGDTDVESSNDEVELVKKSDGYYIYVYNKSGKILDKVPTSITITESYDKYVGRMYLFAASGRQTRGIFKGYKEQVTNSITLKLPQMQIDVSLQKYIYSVNGSVTDLGTTRKNIKAGDNNGNGNKDVNATNSATLISTPSGRKTKKQLPVAVNLASNDAFVTFRITIYNNSNTDVKVKIKDTLPVGITGYYWDDYSSSKTVTPINTGTTASLEKEETVYHNSFKDVYFTARVPYGLSGTIYNKAQITKITDLSTGVELTNSTKYRTIDYDFLTSSSTIAKPDISIQKYIRFVGNVNSSGTLTFDANSRQNKWADQNQKNEGKDITSTYYHATSDKITSAETFIKNKNAVKINTGDIVAYRVLIYRNNANTTDVKVKLKDVISNPAFATHYLVYTITETGTGATGVKDTKTNLATTGYDVGEFDDIRNKIEQSAKNAAKNLSATSASTTMIPVPSNGELTIPELTFTKDGKKYIDCYIVVYYGGTDTGSQIKNKVEISSVQAGTQRTNEATYRTDDADYVEGTAARSNVSLQKYIYAIKKNGESSFDTAAATIKDLSGNNYTRNSKFPDTSSSEEKSKYIALNRSTTPYTPGGYQVSTADEASSKWKNNNPILVSKDDTVLYKIALSNNNDESAGKVVITEKFSKQARFMGCAMQRTGDTDMPILSTSEGTTFTVKNTDESATGITYTFAERNKDTNYCYYTITVNNLDKYGGSIYFALQYNDIKVFNANIENQAKIENDQCNPTNDPTFKLTSGATATYRTTDMDYVRAQGNDISLQEYIISTDDGSTVVTYDSSTSRENKKYDDSTKYEIYKKEDGSVQASSGTNKYYNPVKVQDDQTEVTYKLKVYNNTNVTQTNITVTNTHEVSAVTGDGYRIYDSSGSQVSSGAVSWGGSGTRTFTISSIPAFGYCEITFTLKGFTENRNRVVRSYLQSSSSVFRVDDSDVVKLDSDEPKDVSVQKYIIGVNSTNLGENRRSLKATSSDSPYISKSRTVAEMRALLDAAKAEWAEAAEAEAAEQAEEAADSGSEPSLLEQILGFTIDLIRFLIEGAQYLFQVINQSLQQDLDDATYEYINELNAKFPTTDIDNVLDYSRIKIDEPVEIIAGDTVYYKFKVYNNGDAEFEYNESTKKITLSYGGEVTGKLTDTLPELAESYCWGTSESAVRSGSMTSVGANRQFEIPFNIPDGEYYREYFVAVKFKEDITQDQKDENHVTVSYVKGDNSGTYRTEDSDYVNVSKKEEYYASIEKYVSKVSDYNEEDPIIYSTERKGKATYAQLSGGTFIYDDNASTNNTYKYDNVVEVEKGDILEYQIVVRNDGEDPFSIVEIQDTLPSQLAYKSISASNGATASYSSGVIKINGGSGLLLNGGDSITITIKTKVTTISSSIITNTAKIKTLKSRTGAEVTSIELSKNDNQDSEYIKTRVDYKSSVDKYVYQINDSDLTQEQSLIGERSGKQEYNSPNTNTKYNSVVTLESGDIVKYAITIRNTGDTKIYVDKIQDTLPTGVTYRGITTSKGNNLISKVTQSGRTFTIELRHTALLEKDDEVTVYIDALVTESNLSLNCLKNTAKLTQIVNRNMEVVNDITPDDNEDSDYIQLIDVPISGMVWEDKALSKDGGVFNGEFDAGHENVLDDITVYLNRNGASNIGETKTESGSYKFDSENIDVSNANEKYIKAAKVSGTNRWATTYYNYYVIFEYNGIKYTSTTTKTGARYIAIGSLDDVEHVTNAAEDMGKVKETRDRFNQRFDLINNTGKASGGENQGLAYNENSPGHSYIYNESTMSIQSSTDRIALSNSTTLEEALAHVDLGIKPKDELDFELLADVSKVDVKVNGVTETYDFQNIIQHRASDLYQNIRYTDMESGTTVGAGGAHRYSTTGLDIKVTYRVTIENTSATPGIVTKIIDYYDKGYVENSLKVYDAAMNPLTVSINSITPGSADCYAKEITTNLGEIPAGGKAEIFIELTVKDPEDALGALTEYNNMLPMYNMIEISEYKSTGDKYMRGLIDKDSAPGTAYTEEATVTTGGTGETTVEYYFNGSNLNSLKFEDDTYCAPVLHLVKADERRVIKGKVFRDLEDTPNGEYNDGTDRPIAGATVKLVETVDGGAALNSTAVTGFETRTDPVTGETQTIYETTTDENGNFEIVGFLPGKHVIEYYYGDNEATLIVDDLAKPNGKDSYNGYLYRSTTVASSAGYQSGLGDHWYLDAVENQSIAEDVTSRRNDVDAYTQNLRYDKTTILNSFYGGNYGAISGTLGANTYMQANSHEMLIDVEPTTNDPTNGVVHSGKFLNDYIIANMCFGIKDRPEQIVTLEKVIEKIEIVDTTRTNTLASIEFDTSVTPTQIRSVVGDILSPDGTVDISMRDETLQGAYMQIKYKIKVNQQEVAHGEAVPDVKITRFADYIPNNLNFNGELKLAGGADQSTVWDLVADRGTFLENNLYMETNKRTRLLNEHSVMVEANNTNQIRTGASGAKESEITLETVLSSTNSTVEQIIASAQNLIYDYVNKVELLETNSPGSPVLKTRGYWYAADGTEHDSDPVLATLGREAVVLDEQEYEMEAVGGAVQRKANGNPTQPIEIDSSETHIHPPTGDSGIATSYYIIGAIALAVVSFGTFWIRKFVIKNNK